MKKLTTILLILALTITPTFAANVGVIINDTPVQFTEATGAPFIDSNNRTLVPMRVVMEQYGCTVDWISDTKTAIVKKEGITVEVPIGETFIRVNSEQITNDTSAVIINGRTYLPIRAVLEAVGANVEWDSATKSVVASAVEEGSMSYEEFIDSFNILVFAEETQRGNSVEGYTTETRYRFQFCAKTMNRDELIIALKNNGNRQHIHQYIINNYELGSVKDLHFYYSPEPHWTTTRLAEIYLFQGYNDYDRFFEHFRWI